MAKHNNCFTGPTLLFACSGAADVGEVADLVARQLTRDGVGKMSCLAGLAGRVDGILASTQAAERVLAIDGCDMDCGRQVLELAEVEGFGHIRVTDLGFEKGGTDATDDTVAKVAEKAWSLLDQADNGEDKA